MIKNHETGKFRGFAFVQFDDKKSLNNALTKNGLKVKGFDMVVKVADPKNKAKKTRLEKPPKVVTETVSSSSSPPPTATATTEPKMASGGPKFNIYIS